MHKKRPSGVKYIMPDGCFADCQVFRGIIARNSDFSCIFPLDMIFFFMTA